MSKTPPRAPGGHPNELEQLVEQWILAFCEAPPLLDAELMRATLAEYGPDRRSE